MANVVVSGLFVAAAAALGHALQQGNGFYDPVALSWVLAAGAMVIVAIAAMSASQAEAGAYTWALSALLAAGIGWQIVALTRATPGMYLNPAASTNVFTSLILGQVAVMLLGLLVPKCRSWWFPAVLALHLAAGVWMLRASPSPAIDVVTVHRAAIAGLLRGRNPYSITFQNIYGPDSPFYNPQAVSGDQVLFGYPYPPLSLVLAVPAQLLAGDYRYLELASLVLAGAFIGYATRSTNAKLAAVLFLTTPRIFFVLEQGWTEPVAVLLLALTVWAGGRRPALASWASGLLLVSKQYLVLAAPIVLRMAWKNGRITPTFVVRSLIAGSVVTLPFLLWNPRAFVETVVLLQAREPFRLDSLSLLSWAARAGWGQGSFLWPLAAGAVATAFAMWRTPNTPAGAAASVSLSALAAFVFGSKAFCNYYFFVVGALCCTVAAFSGGAASSSTNRSAIPSGSR